MIVRITPTISLDASELREEFLRASGAGGQNIQKVETAVQLRLDVANSPNIPNSVKNRLLRLAGHRATLAGEVIITAQTHRTQARNRDDALARLIDLIREAAKPPPPVRKPTKPSKGSRLRRLDGKTKRGEVKRQRGKPSAD